MPTSVHDTRADTFGYYPTDHLAALTDRSARPGLLDGAHSLWFDYVKALLHQALTDLDEAAARAPAPVQTAIIAELEAEARNLRAALADFSEGVVLPETKDRRIWEFEAPFVAFDGLDGEDRDHLNRIEDGISDERRRKGGS